MPRGFRSRCRADADDAVVAEGEAPGSAFDADEGDISPEEGRELPVEVVKGERRDAAPAFDAEVSARVRLDVREHFAKPSCETVRGAARQRVIPSRPGKLRPGPRARLTEIAGPSPAGALATAIFASPPLTR